MGISKDKLLFEKVKMDKDVNEAVNFAIKAHEGQVRKKDKKTPYVAHALDVMDKLISCMDYEFMHICEELGMKGASSHDVATLKNKNKKLYDAFYDAYKDVIIGGVLHDVVEDTHKQVSREEKLKKLGEKFGQAVADIVDVMTEWKEDAYDDRKNTQQKRILDASRGAKLVKCADNISNLGETVFDVKNGDIEAWKIYKIKPTEVVRNHIDTLGALEELDGNPLYAQFCLIVEEARGLAQRCEAELGTKFWDDKAASKRVYPDGDVEKYFRTTYDGDKSFKR